jgi:broad specificity phosphatase PhoE
MSVIHLIRHCERETYEQNPDRPWQLTERGRRQASYLGETLAKLPITCILSSPYQRCQDTAAPLARACSKSVHVEQGLAEHELQIHGDRQTYNELNRKVWQYDTFRPPSGETSREALARIMGVLHGLKQRYPDGLVFVFTHKHVINLVRKSLDLDFSFTASLTMPMPAHLKLVGLAIDEASDVVSQAVQAAAELM